MINPTKSPLPTQTQETNIHALSGIQTRDPSSQAAAELRLRPHDQQIGEQKKYTGYYIHKYQTNFLPDGSQHLIHSK
jgi:hypothetical protein